MSSLLGADHRVGIWEAVCTSCWAPPPRAPSQALSVAPGRCPPPSPHSGVLKLRSCCPAALCLGVALCSLWISHSAWQGGFRDGCADSAEGRSPVCAVQPPQPSTSRVTLGGLPSQVANAESIGLSQELDLKKSDGEEERPVCRSEPRLGLGWSLAS